MADQALTIRFGAEGQDVVTAAMEAMRATAEKLKAALKSVASADVTMPLKDMQAAFRAGATAAEGMGGMVQLLSGGLEALKSPAGMATAGIGALVGVLTHATGVAEETFRSVRNLSAVTGLGAEETKTLQEAFKLMGLEADSMDRAMFRLSAEIEQGGKRLAAYGINVRDVNGHLRPTGEIFEEVVKKIGSIGDAAQRNAVLLQLFGRAGRELAPLFAQGGASLDEFKKKAQDLGIYTAEDQAATQELVRAKAALSVQMEHLWLDIAKVAIPIVEGFVAALGYLVSATTAIFGLMKAWVTWMATAPEAIDPLSLSIKALALSFQALGSAFEYLQKFGKFVADLIVAPVGKPGGTAEEKKEAGPGGPIATSDTVTAEAKYREEQLKVNERFFAEQSRLQTGSQTASLKAQETYLVSILELERKKAKDLLALTDDPVQTEKIKRELALKEVQIEGEKNLLILKIREQEAADAKKLLEDQLKARKDATDEEVKLIALHRDEDIQQAERAELGIQEMTERRKDVEINAARDTAAAKQALISEEIARLKALGAEYADNAALQRDIQNRLIALAHERATIEMDATRQVDKAKEDAFRADQARKEKEAGLFGQMIRAAQEYAKAQGRAQITLADINAAQVKQSADSQALLAKAFGGGTVDPAQLEKAWQFTQQQRQLQKEGFTPGSVTSAALAEAGKTYGAGFGYEAATQAFQSGDIGTGQMLLQRAKIMEQAGDITKPDEVSNAVKSSIDPKIAQLKTQIEAGLTTVTDKWGELVQAIPDKITRWLEAEAARN